ncbi:MAG: metal ABC transporter permease [Actinomycetales bacterium]|nr:metal ABC transporter permease [Actinomycetales bacterium]
MDILDYDFMRRALVAAALIGVIAPLIGVYLVQRRLALLGDGMGHVALTGVGLAFLTGLAPVPTALVVAALGALLLELIRSRSRAAGDLALALVFYGGIAGGVLLTSLSSNKASTALNQYLFGSLSTVAQEDIWWLVGAGALVLLVLAYFGREMFAMTLDPDTAHVQGIRTTRLGVLLTVLAAVTVVIGMRTVGLLLVSAIMIVPVAAAQQLASSFRSTMIGGVLVGLACSLVGLTSSFSLDVPPGPTIVLLALLVFVITALIAIPLRRRRTSHPHPVDDVDHAHG